MLKCVHKDCNYETGWTHKGGSDNKMISPKEGDFYQIKAEFTTVNAERFHGDDNDMKLLGCPKCRRTFITKGEFYIDTQQEER